MSDDLSKAIKQIGEMLSQDKGGDSLMSLLSLLGSSGSKESEVKEDKKENKKDKENRSESYPSGDVSQDNSEMVRQITNIMSSLNTRNDPRVHLLSALKPFLSRNRQKKLSNCIMLLQLTSVMRAMETNKESDRDGL